MHLQKSDAAAAPRSGRPRRRHLYSLKQRTAAVAMTVLLGSGLGACSPIRAFSVMRMAVDPPPRVILGPEDVQRWIEVIQTDPVRGRRNCDEQCALRSMGIPTDIEFWRPSRSEIRRFEQELSRELRQAQNVLLSHYSVGYIGFIQDGKRLIHAKGECGYSDLRQPWGIIMDGGSCYFEANFDPATGELGVGFNSVA